MCHRHFYPYPLNPKGKIVTIVSYALLSENTRAARAAAPRNPRFAAACRVRRVAGRERREASRRAALRGSDAAARRPAHVEPRVPLTQPARCRTRGVSPSVHTSRLNWFYPGLIFPPKTRTNRVPELSPCIPIRVNPYPVLRCKQRVYED